MLALKKVFAAAVLFSFCFPAVFAGAAVGPVISSATADAGSGTILINGFNFPADPKVYMGRSGKGMDRLPILSSGRTVIEASLLNTAPGTYLLAVLDQGLDTTEMASISVTIAPAGLQGDPGPRGVPGNLALAGESCPNGQYLVGFDATGSPICTDYCWNSAECGAGEFCYKNYCGNPGACQTLPQACVALPVCGCDGVTYGDPCQAAAAGTNVASFGPCP